MVVMVAPVDPKRARTFDHESLPWPKVEEKRSEPSPALDRDRDIHLLDFAKNAIRATAAREGELNDSILYAGMNPSSAPTELAGLRANGANVTATRSQGNVTDTLAFAKSIGLSGEQAQRVADILSSTKNNGELAAIAKVWASGRAPSRLVLSGHSGGSDVHAGYDHVIRFKDVQRLAAAMPGAAACIEDIHLSGCNTGLEATSKEERDQWVRAFPNLQTLWGYQGSCPTAPGGDMAIWESRTRGRAHLDLSGLEKTPIVISDRFGHIDGAAVRKPLAEVLADLKWAKEEHPKLMAGDIRSWGGGDDDPECPHGLFLSNLSGAPSRPGARRRRPDGSRRGKGDG